MWSEILDQNMLLIQLSAIQLSGGLCISGNSSRVVTRTSILLSTHLLVYGQFVEFRGLPVTQNTQETKKCFALKFQSFFNFVTQRLLKSSVSTLFQIIVFLKKTFIVILGCQTANLLAIFIQIGQFHRVLARNFFLSILKLLYLKKFFSLFHKSNETKM